MECQPRISEWPDAVNPIIISARTFKMAFIFVVSIIIFICITHIKNTMQFDAHFKVQFYTDWGIEVRIRMVSKSDVIKMVLFYAGLVWRRFVESDHL